MLRKVMKTITCFSMVMIPDTTTCGRRRQRLSYRYFTCVYAIYCNLKKAVGAPANSAFVSSVIQVVVEFFLSSPHFNSFYENYVFLNP